MARVVRYFTEVDSDGGRYACKRCTKDPVTFSIENDMDSGPVPNKLTGLTRAGQLRIALKRIGEGGKVAVLGVELMCALSTIMREDRAGGHAGGSNT